ncbi:hypothetical protein AMTRI_Chr10g229400 [Amborella trichopoda]|uniref:TATA box binding protein associated factor (TAF) histone-like fold domain-containing protein n=1 Tax=Amborella trichopoda TaxID=13333 RepID=W1P187_AMBTC|nr:transcription initiation factor TFIID subunit 6 isoform X2 [Amborella trichopoda]ERN01668.1 hypothetical protein AMTR_s00090p00135570 [Amborella trichopoda]|eukprot:XP_006839099.1 transcription initiation factor TFIID subunit 6 isoform X2 [Amborella trichopoda]
MSIIPKENIEVIAQSVGINNLAPDVAVELAKDVEYRIREIMQEAIKCMRHSKRTVLTAEDVDSALSLRNVEPIYGFASGDPLRFKRAAGHKDLFYVDDKDVEFKDVIDAPLPKAPLDTAVVAHWLAIEGIQPAIPENATVDVIVAPSEHKKSEHKEDGLPVDIKLPVKHVLSRELQMYFDKITELIVGGSDSVLFKEALVSLATDSGLHPLVPYFTYFIADEVTRSLNEFQLLYALMRVVRSLLQNPHIHIEPYLHQLMPCVITCLVAKRLGHKFADNHWKLRDFTASLVALICRRFGHAYHNLQPRVTRTLLHAFLDPNKARTQHYGAIQGLAALGPSVVRLLILPNLEPFLQLLEKDVLGDQKNEMKRNEAWRVYGALLRASGQCLYDRLKHFPNVLSPSSHAAWKLTGRPVITTPPNKRKVGPDQSAEQPPLKKAATDGLLSPNSTTSFQTEPPQTQVGDTVTMPMSSADASHVGPSSSSTIRGQHDSVGPMRGVAGRGALNASKVLGQAWKDDMDAGRLLASLFELFGESMFSFIQPPERLFFL